MTPAEWMNFIPLFEFNQFNVRLSANHRTSKDLVAEILYMFIRECLTRTDDLVEIG